MKKTMLSFGITLNCLIAFTTLDISFLDPKENTYNCKNGYLALYSGDGISNCWRLYKDIGQNHNEIYFYGVRMSILLISYKEKTHFFVIW